MMPALALALALAAPPVPAPTDAEVRAHAEALLETIDTRIPAERFRAMGPAAMQVLADVAVSDDKMPTTRSQALGLLAALDAPAAERISRALVDSPDAPVTVRETAVRTLGHVLPPAQLRSALSPVLRAGRPSTLRAVAAETLARHAGEDACAEVMDQVALEPDAARPTFHRAEASCAARRGGAGR